MVKNLETKILKINTPLRGHAAGTTKRVRVAPNGSLLDPYWRRRVKDAETDGCVELIETKQKSKKAKAETKMEETVNADS